MKQLAVAVALAIDGLLDSSFLEAYRLTFVLSPI